MLGAWLSESNLPVCEMGTAKLPLVGKSLGSPYSREPGSGDRLETRGEVGGTGGGTHSQCS